MIETFTHELVIPVLTLVPVLETFTHELVRQLLTLVPAIETFTHEKYCDGNFHP